MLRRIAGRGKNYRVGGVDFITFIEVFLAFYFVAGVILGVYFSEYALLPFHIMLAAGFGCVAAFTFWQARSIQRMG